MANCVQSHELLIASMNYICLGNAFNVKSIKKVLVWHTFECKTIVELSPGVQFAVDQVDRSYSCTFYLYHLSAFWCCQSILLACVLIALFTSRFNHSQYHTFLSSSASTVWTNFWFCCVFTAQVREVNFSKSILGLMRPCQVSRLFSDPQFCSISFQPCELILWHLTYL